MCEVLTLIVLHRVTFLKLWMKTREGKQLDQRSDCFFFSFHVHIEFHDFTKDRERNVQLMLHEEKYKTRAWKLRLKFNQEKFRISPVSYHRESNDFPSLQSAIISIEFSPITRFITLASNVIVRSFKFHSTSSIFIPSVIYFRPKNDLVEKTELGKHQDRFRQVCKELTRLIEINRYSPAHVTLP